MENLNKSFEPMDIDLSGQSTSAMDISYNNSTSEVQSPEEDEDCYIVSSSVPKRVMSPRPSVVPTKSPIPCLKPKTETAGIKKFHINVQSQGIKKLCKRQLKILSFLLVVLFSALLYHNKVYCYKEYNLNHLKDTLINQVFGQDEAIESLINALNADTAHKILFLYGGTGVGKTLTSSLLMDNIGLSSNLYHYTMPTFAESIASDLMLGLIMCESSTIIVDDLNIDNNISEPINKVIAKSDYLESNLTIILIHNCAGSDNMFHRKCDESIQSIFLKNYQNIKASFYFIKFKELTDFHLRKCIDRELGDMKLDKLTYEKVVKKFNVTSDGCKGVHTKVKSLNM